MEPPKYEMIDIANDTIRM